MIELTWLRMFLEILCNQSLILLGHFNSVFDCVFPQAYDAAFLRKCPMFIYKIYSQVLKTHSASFDSGTFITLPEMISLQCFPLKFSSMGRLQTMLGTHISSFLRVSFCLLIGTLRTCSGPINITTNNNHGHTQTVAVIKSHQL